MQWSDAENAGFTAGSPWRALNANYETVNVKAELEDPNSLLNHYQTLIQLRKETPALLSGNATLIDTGNSAAFALLRQSSDESILIIVNLRDEPLSDYSLSLEESILTDGSSAPTSLFGAIQAQPLEIINGQFTGYKPVIELLPYQTYIFQLQ